MQRPRIEAGEPAASGSIPHVVATGFTTAYLGDERSLREFIVGDWVVRRLLEAGHNAVLYLINDSFDPLTDRQLRVGVNKDPKLMRQFTPFCGRPISEIPDPFGCHPNYSNHFCVQLVDRLHGLGICPVVLDTYSAYRQGHYAPFVKTTIEQYDRIQKEVSDRWHNYTVRNLLRVQCPECSCLDSSEIIRVDPTHIAYSCSRCSNEMRQPIGEVRGKLSWKLDCAARWNLYRVDTETFSKSHLADLGTLNISKYMSSQFYGGVIPTVVGYGDVRIDRSCSNRLLEILPPRLFYQLLIEHRQRDLDLTREVVESFCRRVLVRPGLSYVDYVRREVPQEALQADLARNHHAPRTWTARERDRGLDSRSLLEYGKKFGEFFYGKTYDLKYPDASAIADADPDTLATAQKAILLALDLRRRGGMTTPEVKAHLQWFLAGEPAAPRVYPCLRRLFGQNGGPKLTTLLAVLPLEYLATAHAVLGLHREQAGGHQNVEEYIETQKAA